jgi:hypothetical protein
VTKTTYITEADELTGGRGVVLYRLHRVLQIHFRHLAVVPLNAKPLRGGPCLFARQGLPLHHHATTGHDGRGVPGGGVGVFADDVPTCPHRDRGLVGRVVQQFRGGWQWQKKEEEEEEEGGRRKKKKEEEEGRRRKKKKEEEEGRRRKKKKEGGRRRKKKKKKEEEERKCLDECMRPLLVDV